MIPEQKEAIFIAQLLGSEISDQLIANALTARAKLLASISENNSFRDYLEGLRYSSSSEEILSKIIDFSYLMPHLSKHNKIWQNFLLSQFKSSDFDVRISAAQTLAEHLTTLDKDELEQFIVLYLNDDTFYKQLIIYNATDALITLVSSFLEELEQDRRDSYLQRLLKRIQSLDLGSECIRLQIELAYQIFRFSQSEDMQTEAFAILEDAYLRLDETLSIASLYWIYQLYRDDLIGKKFLSDLLIAREYRQYVDVQSYIMLRIGLKNKVNYRLKNKEIYHNNLKASLAPEIKLFYIEILCHQALANKVDLFYSAIHFSNMLKISNNQRVMQSSAMGLIELFDYLEMDLKADITEEFLRFLEVEDGENARFVAGVLGLLLCRLEYDSYRQILSKMLHKAKTSQSKTTILFLNCVAIILVAKIDISYKKEASKLLLLGLAHFNASVRANGYNCLATIFSKNNASEQEIEIYTYLAKKIYALSLEEQGKIELACSSWMVAHSVLADYITAYRQEYGKEKIDTPLRAAFYPGSFDPFSTAHLECVTMIRDLGFEVYLAVDEFSWSKRTQANLIRREIINLSIASEENIYIYPQSESVNISNPSDLQRLRYKFFTRPIYLVMGADVLTGASAYRKAESEKLLCSFSHIIFERHLQADQQKLEEAIAKLRGDVIRLQLPAEAESVSSTLIRNNIDRGKNIDALVDPLARMYIEENNLYRFEPLFKDTMTDYSIAVEVIEAFTPQLLMQLEQEFHLGQNSLSDLLCDDCHKETARILIIKDLKEQQIMAFSIFHWLRSSMIYYEFESEVISDYIRQQAVGRIILIDLLCTKKEQRIKNIEQALIAESLAFNLAKDYAYAIYRPAFNLHQHKIIEELELQGFVAFEDKNQRIYSVDMNAPITLNLDVKTMIKAPFRDDIAVNQAIAKSRLQLKRSLSKFFPGQLVLTFDRSMIYEHLIKLICTENDVPTAESQPRQLGENMLVTYGDLFKRWRIPNTVTKALHSERYYHKHLDDYSILSHPNYLSLQDQINMITSFQRPVILLDDLMDRGKRFKILERELTEQNVGIKSLVVAILTGRGKSYMEMKKINVSAAYYLPKIKLWFNEAMLYPFIGGDAVLADKSNAIDAFYSLNHILPYAYPRFLEQEGICEEKVKEFSLACLSSAKQIIEALEQAYYQRYGQVLTLYHLSDVFISPRFPYHGQVHQYNLYNRASDYLKDDIEKLERIAGSYRRGINEN